MPKASKSIKSTTGHRTKAEIEFRLEGENNLKTGIKLKEFDEVKNNEVAHLQFLRVRKLLEKNDKNDDMYSAVINRYCLLFAECHEYEKLKDAYSDSIEEISKDKSLIVEDFVDDANIKETISLVQYYKLKNNFGKTITSLDAAIMAKRKMMFDIEKENLMTVASGLRSVPKTPPEEKSNPLWDALNNDD